MTRAQRRVRWEAFVARFGLGPDRIETEWGPVTPWTVSEFHPDPARRATFYLGVGQPQWLNVSPVPLFLSATTLARYQRRGEDFPVRMNGTPWAGDSGAYSALKLTRHPDRHPWWQHADEYGGMWVRLIGDVGPPAFVAVQDWPCEPSVREQTGLAVLEHQQLTLESYLYLTSEFPMVPWLPVLQGWAPRDYLRHYDMYEQAGVRLEKLPLVGVGSICRRGSQRDVARVLGALAPVGLRLHGFGVSINALRVVGHLLESADSQAWSYVARQEHVHLPECNHLSRRPDPVTGERRRTDCRNCLRYAITYREEVMAAFRDAAWARERDPQLALFDHAPVSPTEGAR